eukprot:scaffold6713_cov20-Tisochrysis_lutea.AAC.2
MPRQCNMPNMMGSRTPGNWSRQLENYQINLPSKPHVPPLPRVQLHTHLELSAGHGQHLVRVDDGVQAVCDGDGGALSKHTANGALYQRIRLEVHGGGGLIQQQHLGALQHAARHAHLQVQASHTQSARSQLSNQTHAGPHNPPAASGPQRSFGPPPRRAHPARLVDPPPLDASAPGPGRATAQSQESAGDTMWVRWNGMLDKEQAKDRRHAKQWP